MAPGRDKLVSEFVGTFFLVLTVGFNVLQNQPLAPVSIGAILMVMIFATGSVSGAHFNPAVSLGCFVADLSKPRDKRGLSVADMLIYMVVQLGGGLFAAIIYCATFQASFTLKPGPGYGAMQASLCEIFFTCALVFVVLNVATTTQDASNHYYGLAIGFTVMSAAFAIGSISGCSLNPAVTFGVMVTHAAMGGGGLSWFPVYIVMPLLGACLAAGFFMVVRKAEYVQAKAESMDS